MGQREVLGDELAKEHGEDVDESGRHEGCDAGRQPPRQARAPQQAREQVSQGALRRVPQQDRRQRDAHLGAGKLGGQGAGRRRGRAREPGGGGVKAGSVAVHDSASLAALGRDPRALFHTPPAMPILILNETKGP